MIFNIAVVSIKHSRLIVLWCLAALTIGLIACDTKSSAEVVQGKSSLWRLYEVRLKNAEPLVQKLKQYELENRLKQLEIQESFPVKITFYSDEKVLEELLNMNYPIKAVHQ